MHNRRTAWLSAGSRMLPLFIAEAVIWLGFGAPRPILSSSAAPLFSSTGLRRLARPRENA